MKKVELRKLIDTSEKRGVVVYKGKDARKKFDESVTQKKLIIFSKLIGDKIGEVKRILET
ncbi:hypothetical protein EG339_06530 [Chryseobacterium bernardetii]|uniref:Uncharacterized protein n=1 Tax=Chryseobacterium bernardetii TaxID=1241978 RepID=A0A3G6T511_9FLAO|nr:hypothetical protein [Chryseobacterium bernardetii]AZB24288.1 hypothetical protein EG339_06530 [Chryseobacterium bernardetii]